MVGAKGQIPVPTLPGGGANINAIIAASVSRDPWWYYSTLKLAPGTVLQPAYQLFNAAIGQPDPNPLVGGPAVQTLTKVETNMPQACSSGFSAPRDLIMDGIGIYPRSSGVGVAGSAVGTFANVSDMQALEQYTYFEFKIIDKIFAEGPISFKPAGLGFYGVSTALGQQVFTMGVAHPHAVQRVGLNFAKYLASLMPWSFTLYCPANAGPGGVAVTLLTQLQGGNGLEIMFYLSGLTDRAIQ